jgi:vesicle transport through interaction with t-SNAREs protein 1
MAATLKTMFLKRYYLWRSQQVAFESEEVGGEIVSDLGVQRETIERTRTRLQETNAEISRSRKVVRRIYFGIIQNKIVLVVIIVIELAIVAAMIYWKFIAR